MADKPQPKRGRGRPDKLTPEVQGEFVRILRAGNYIDTACDVIGVSESTMNNWRERGRREATGKYRDFLVAIRKAQGEAEMALLEGLQQSGEMEWQSRAWRLERKFPKRWGRQRLSTGLEGIPDGTRKITFELEPTNDSPAETDIQSDPDETDISYD